MGIYRPTEPVDADNFADFLLKQDDPTERDFDDDDVIAHATVLPYRDDMIGGVWRWRGVTGAHVITDPAEEDFVDPDNLAEAGDTLADVFIKYWNDSAEGCGWFRTTNVAVEAIPTSIPVPRPTDGSDIIEWRIISNCGGIAHDEDAFIHYPAGYPELAIWAVDGD